MNSKGKGRVNGAACSEKNKSVLQTSTGDVPAQTRVIAVGKQRLVLLDMLSALWHTDGFEDAVVTSSGPYERDTVFVVCFDAKDKTTEAGAVNDFGVEVTAHDWRPLLNIPALPLDQDLIGIGGSVEYASDQARVIVRGGRTILTAPDPRALVDELRAMTKHINRVSDTLENLRNWQPIPDNVKVSFRWWPILPAEVGL